jgi:ABC-type arginine transport system permease subunit
MFMKILRWVGDVLLVFIIIYGTVGLLLSCNEKSSFMIKMGVDGGR